ncbi:MAG: hypothetical protein ACRDGA_01945 [Bacteroidota bacterium]
MGRTALFLVMGVGVALGVIGYNISDTTQRALENNYTYYKYMYARNLARTAIYTALRSYDNGNVTPATGTDVSFAHGSYEIVSLSTSAAPADTLRMTTRGSFADTSYTITLSLFRETKPFPQVNSALGVLATLQSFATNGKPQVDGRNYNATGTSLVGSGDLPGVTTLSSTDSATVYANAFHANGDTLIRGATEDGTNQRVVVDADPEDPSTFIDEYEQNHDVFLGAGTYTSQNYGTSTNPVIVFCDAGTGTVKFAGTTTGYGILAVKGPKLSLAGTFNWYGLVVILSDSATVEFDEAGNANITGALIVAQANYGNAKLSLSGTGSNPGKIRYSSDALMNATNVGRLRYYHILDWYE